MTHPSVSSPGPAGHVLAAAACGVTDFIHACGADPDRILGEVGFNPRDLEDPCATVPLARYVAMMEAAARRSHNPRFGLGFGQQFQPEQLGLIGQLALAAPDIGTGLAAFARCFGLHQQDTETRLVREATMLRLEYRIIDPEIWSRRQDAELTMGMFVNLLRRALGSRLDVEEVWFEHPQPEQSHAHEAAFGAPVFFNAATNAITFRATGLDRPMPGRDPARFVALAEDLRRIGSGARPLDLMPLVMSEIRRCLADGPPGIDRIAERLRVPRWTLQRRLAEHGVCFSSCVDQVRARLSLIYLAEPHISIAAIAELLGYSEVSAFSRACKRLHGAAPDAVRRGLTRSPAHNQPGRHSPAQTDRFIVMGD
ncbi:AraC-like transcriptional regulator QhpR [Acidiphilium sp.]|uniref:AraC-like transcriptional regulator QhpR n=1 Tax=Acidiphilium sp. TaxID=527 RepID=UPI003D078EC0